MPLGRHFVECSSSVEIVWHQIFNMSAVGEPMQCIITSGVYCLCFASTELHCYLGGGQRGGGLGRSCFKTRIKKITCFHCHEKRVIFMITISNHTSPFELHMVCPHVKFSINWGVLLKLNENIFKTIPFFFFSHKKFLFEE